MFLPSEPLFIYSCFTARFVFDMCPDISMDIFLFTTYAYIDHSFIWNSLICEYMPGCHIWLFERKNILPIFLPHLLLKQSIARKHLVKRSIKTEVCNTNVTWSLKMFIFFLPNLKDSPRLLYSSLSSDLEKC